MGTSRGMGKALACLAVGAGIMYGAMHHKMDRMRAGYESRIAQYQKNDSDPDFLLGKYNGVVTGLDMKPAGNCADPKTINVLLTSTPQGSCVEISDLATHSKSPVKRLQSGGIVAGDYKNAAIEAAKQEATSTIDGIGNRIRGYFR